MDLINERIFYRNPEANEIFKGIIFLKRKLDSLKSKIDFEYNAFCEDCINFAITDIEGKLKKVKKTENQELKLEEVFISSQADNELFFNLDSFFIDVKRIVEFMFRLIAKLEGLGTIKFSLENLLEQISSEYKGNKSKFVEILLEKYPLYVKNLLSKINWFNSLNFKRTQVMHYGIFNKTDGFRVIFHWNSMMTLKDKPTITFPGLSMFNKPIKETLEKDMKDLRRFLTESLDLRKDLIEKVRVI